MDLHSRYIELIAAGNFNEARALLPSIPKNIRYAYRFLLDEVNEKYDCGMYNPTEPLEVKAARIRCIYRKSATYVDVIEKAKALPTIKEIETFSQSDQFWILFNTLTMGFAYHSMGNFGKAEKIYNSVAELDSGIVSSGILEIEARVTLMELYLDLQNENGFHLNESLLLSLFERYPNRYLKAIFMIARSEWTYFNGDYKETISLLERAEQLLSEIQQLSYSARVIARQGRLHQEFGEFKMAVALFDRAMKEFDKLDAHYIEKAFLYKARSQLKFQSGDVDQAKIDLLTALELVKKSDNPIEIGKVYFRLLELGFHSKEFEFANDFLLKLENLCQRPESKALIPYLEFGTYLSYRSQDRIIPFARSFGLLQKLVLSENLPFILRLYANYELLVMYITELMIFFNDKVLTDINKTFSTLFELSQSFPSKYFAVKLLLLKARFSIIVHDPQMAEKYISEAEAKATKWGILRLIESVQDEKLDLIQRAKASELFLKAFQTTNVAEELRTSEIREYLEMVKKIIQAYE